VIYIEGYSLVSSIGDSAKESVESLRVGWCEPLELDFGAKYYKIPNTKPIDYYDIIEGVVRDAIANAELSTDELTDIALFLGTSSAKLPLNETYAKESAELLKEPKIDDITEIISNRVGIEGFRTIISTACSSSANALIQAKEMIESGLISRAIVVGVELYNELTIRGFESFMLLTRDRMKPFDRDRDGIVLGEALSAVVLSRNKSRFALVGGAIRVDTTSITAPTPEHLAKVMSEAIKSADISTIDIRAIKTHSTATRQNDNAEAKGIWSLFGEDIPNIVTLKPYIGHTMGACGTNELVLFIESIREGFIPKNINFENIDSECKIEPNLEEMSVESGYYLLNYFGFGGNNSSLVIKCSRE
jgi:3-oxoacyl-[acyl-carrier-protein] synthase-1